MPLSYRSRKTPSVTGIVFFLIGLALTGAGVWLIALGGSLFYAIAGLGILLIGDLLNVLCEQIHRVTDDAIAVLHTRRFQCLNDDFSYLFAHGIVLQKWGYRYE